MATSGSFTHTVKTGVTVTVNWSITPDYQYGWSVINLSLIGENTTSSAVTLNPTFSITGSMVVWSTEVNVFTDATFDSWFTLGDDSVKIPANSTKIIEQWTDTIYNTSTSALPLYIRCYVNSTTSSLYTGQIDGFDGKSYPIVSGIPTIASAFTVTANRKNSSNTHTLRFKIDSTTVHTVNNVGESSSVTLPATVANYITTSASGVCTLECVTTYMLQGNSTTGTTTTTFNLKVPDSYKPTLTNVVATDSSTTPNQYSTFGFYVNNRSIVSISGTETLSYGSAIVSRKVTFANKTFNSVNIGTLSLGNSSFTNDVYTGNATLTITDARGRSASGTVSLTVRKYSSPSFTATSAYRSDANGNSSPEGERITVNTPYTSSSLNNKNFVKREIYVDNTLVLPQGNTTNTNATQLKAVLDGTYPNSNSYDIRVVLTDTSGSTTTYTNTVPTAQRPLSIKKDGSGLALGRICRQAGLEVGWNAEFDGNVQVDKDLVVKGSTHGVVMEGTHGTAGYIKMCSITITATYINSPFVITFIRRRDFTPTSICVRFTNANSTDPTLEGFYYYGNTNQAYIVKSATSKWDIYITKTEANDYLQILSINNAPYFSSRATVSYPNALVSSVPTGYTQATLGDKFSVGYAATAGTATSATTAANATKFASKDITASGNRWDVIPFVDSSGVIEVGKYIDFHTSDTDTTDYAFRLTGGSGILTGSGIINSNTNIQVQGENLATVASSTHLSGQWLGAGYITASGNSLRFIIPFTKPIIGTLTPYTICVTVRQNNKYIFGDSSDGWTCWYNGERDTFYTDSNTFCKYDETTHCGVEFDIRMLNKGNTPINNDSCGVGVSYDFIVS